MEPIQTIRSRYVVIPIEDIDTDQIIPAKFLKTTTKDGLGQGLFYAWRYDAEGQPRPDFVLNQPRAAGARILVAGHNFGCGSSREHAPWALSDFGFQAVVSTEIADIFRGNSLKNGLLPVVVDRAFHDRLKALAESDPEAEITVDLRTQTISLPDGTSETFPIDEFSRECLLNGLDELGFIQREEQAIAEYERQDRWEVLCAR